MTHRLWTSWSVLLFCALPIFAARAEPAPNPAAEALNEEGKQLFQDKNYAGAAAKFQQAVDTQPDARYYFNLCAAYEKTQDYERALDACDAVYEHDPDDRLKAKTGTRAANIRAQKRQRDAATPPTGGGDGAAGGAGTGTTTGTDPGTGTNGATSGGTNVSYPAAGGAGNPSADVDASPPPGLDYKWSLGATVGGAANLSVGHGMFPTDGTLLKINADFFIAPKSRIGFQAYAAFQNFQRGLNQTDSLNVVDLGGGLFWHGRLARNLFFSPMAGAHFALLTPDIQQDSFVTFGLRAEATLNLVLGHHVLSLTPASFGLYLPTAGELASGTPASDYQLDRTGATFGAGIGYTYRFSDSFYQLFTLE